MTLEEKVAQLQSWSTLPPFLPIGKTPAFGIVKDGEIDDEIAKSAMPDGMGVFLLLSFTPTTGVEDAEHLNAIQSWVIANTRPGSPSCSSAKGCTAQRSRAARASPR